MVLPTPMTEREKKVKGIYQKEWVSRCYVYAARLKMTNPTNHVFGKAPTEMVSCMREEPWGSRNYIENKRDEREEEGQRKEYWSYRFQVFALLGSTSMLLSPSFPS